jgi:hypothetical protein
MRYYEIKRFRKWANAENVNNETLFQAVDEIEKGLVEAVLGGELFKKRIAKTGGGKSGGYRTIIAFRKAKRTFFIAGWEKNEVENISKDELKEYKALAKRLFSYTQNILDGFVEDAKLFELERPDDE